MEWTHFTRAGVKALIRAKKNGDGPDSHSLYGGRPVLFHCSFRSADFDPALSPVRQVLQQRITAQAKVLNGTADSLTVDGKI